MSDSIGRKDIKEMGEFGFFDYFDGDVFVM